MALSGAEGGPGPAAGEGTPVATVRAMGPEDLPAAAIAAAAAFDFDISSRSLRAAWMERVGHVLETDPEGCFVAEVGGAIVGVAEAMVRDGLWVLSLLTVDPAGQGSGAGRRLMQAALAYGPERGPGLIVSSDDWRALRLYHRSGFTLRPTFQAHGPLGRERVPGRAAGIREERDPDFEALAEISREVRGASYTEELRFALRRGARLLTLGRRGFAVSRPAQGVWLLVARDEEAAEALLWAALEAVGEADGRVVRWIGGDQQWAVDVCVRAGLHLSASGALGVRGEPGTLYPFIPSGPFA